MPRGSTKRFGARTVLAGIDLDVDARRVHRRRGRAGKRALDAAAPVRHAAAADVRNLEIDGVDTARTRRGEAQSGADRGALRRRLLGLEAHEWLRFVATARGAGRLDEAAIAAPLARAGLSGRAPMAALPRRLQRRLGLEAAWLSGADLMLIDDADADGGALDDEDPAAWWSGWVPRDRVRAGRHRRGGSLSRHPRRLHASDSPARWPARPRQPRTAGSGGGAGDGDVMAALFLREVTAGTRTRAFAAALGVHAALLAAFVVLWSGGVPLLPGSNLYEQQRLVDAVLLLSLLPWVVARCGADERGDRLVAISAFTATRPSRILLARFLARTSAALAVGLAGLPLMIAAQQISAVPLGSVARDLLPLTGLAMLASAASLVWSLLSSGVILAWAFATASTVLVAIWTGRSCRRPVAAIVLAAFAVAAIASCMARADTSIRYLSERNR